MKTDIHFFHLTAINHRRLIIAVLLSAAVILVCSIQFLFHETEVTDDENTYDFQAQTLLSGRIDNPPPPVRTSFDNVFIINDGYSWIGRYTMGHPAIIAIGMVLGNRYVGIITISILTLLLLYFIGRELYEDRRVALLALCLGAVSPFFYLISSSRSQSYDDRVFPCPVYVSSSSCPTDGKSSMGNRLFIAFGFCSRVCIYTLVHGRRLFGLCRF